MYADVPLDARRTFERSFRDLLFFQAEEHDAPYDWTTGSALYTMQAMAEPVALRFKYHFQGTRSTNRVDKVSDAHCYETDWQPEWAFANILDQIYQHTPFLNTISRLCEGVDLRSEFTRALLPTVLGLLRSRIPQLLDRPALLAHTIYQTVVFDDALREGGQVEAKWEGLTGVILREEGWYDRWLAGERKCT